MPEYRQNPLTREWVIIGSERQARPSEFIEETGRPEGQTCPFCAGNERETPDAIATYPAAKSDEPWAVRVVPNKYPAVSQEPGVRSQETGDRGQKTGVRGQETGRSGLFPSAPAVGQHEVIIESPMHAVSLTELGPDIWETLFTAYRDRLLAHEQDGQSRYVQIFKNVGSAAGASIEHSHSQLMALPEVPEQVRRELAIATEFHARHKRGLLQSILAAEESAKERLVATSKSFVAFCPWASRFPYEVCVAPRTPQPAFQRLQAGELGELARFVPDLIGRIESKLGPVAYNYFLHTAPFDFPRQDHYHWHIEIFPRLTKAAGFEWATGVFINTVVPEAAAAELRSSSRGRRD